MAAEPQGSRTIYSDGAEREAAITARDALRPGHRLSGPWVIEEEGSTTYVPPGWTMTVLEDDTLQLGKEG
jgi:N-methylhydantoinase A/oxoprolinase/acetone carboxylase beta subunit